MRSVEDPGSKVRIFQDEVKKITIIRKHFEDHNKVIIFLYSQTVTIFKKHNNLKSFYDLFLLILRLCFAIT